MEELGFIAAVVGIRKAVRREFEVRAADLEITVAQFVVLRCLWQVDGQFDFAVGARGRFGWRHDDGILDRLENRGLIRRERSTQDRRAVQIWLMPEGRALEAPLMAIIAEINRQALRGISAAEQEKMMWALKK